MEKLKRTSEIEKQDYFVDYHGIFLFINLN